VVQKVSLGIAARSPSLNRVHRIESFEHRDWRRRLPARIESISGSVIANVAERETSRSNLSI
jgi:hypothetical protein